MSRLIIEKSLRRLTLYAQDGAILLACRVALGKTPVGHKQREGDGRTPEGRYYVCLRRENGKFGPALGISYPSEEDARRAVSEGRLDANLLPLFEDAERQQKRPPWGTPLGGEIYVHGGGADRDWTAGCVALEQADMDRLFALCKEGDEVLILP